MNDEAIQRNQSNTEKYAADNIGEPMDTGKESADHHKGSKGFYGTGNYASQIVIFNAII